MTRPAGVDRWWTSSRRRWPLLGSHGPPQRLALGAGSRTDRHEHLGAGRIGAAGLRRLLTHPGLAHVAYLLETPGMDDGYDLVNMGRAARPGGGAGAAHPAAGRVRHAEREGPERAAGVRRRRSRSADRRRLAPAADAARGRPRAPGATRLARDRAPVAILALAALLRLPGLDQRGAWDADQGTDMLVLQGLVDRGEVPSSGPRTSIGTFHHGAVYYYLLAPAAFLSGADPVVVTGEIALFGIGAVVTVWWLARLIGGPLAGLAAALLMAVSPAGIEASTFIWNPNLIPSRRRLRLPRAARGASRHARWWLCRGSARWS